MKTMKTKSHAKPTKPVKSTKTAPASVKPEERVAIISTSDRWAFKSCRRKWNWSSHLRHGLHPVEQRLPLWFGSAMHHALEDFHGRRVYASADAAIDDYVQATRRYYKVENLPVTWEEDVVLMKRMLAHYQHGWLRAGKRDPLRTYVVKGAPQVEVPFEFEIPLPESVLKKSGYTKVVYRGVIDRVVVDENGYLWLVDYKNVASFTNPEHLEFDQQIGVYLWAAKYIYDRPVLGFIYTQFRKKGVEPPRLLKDGTLSVDKDQSTTHALYRHALVQLYGDGSSAQWPEKNVQCLNFLASLEGEEEDKFIRRSRVTRSQEIMHAEADKIIAEVSDMLDPELKIYPFPTQQHCTVMCSFTEPCLAMDRGEDYRYILNNDYVRRDYTERNEWRKFLQVGETDDKPVVKVIGRNDHSTTKK